MKNHIAIKFIAIVMCTLTLLGCVGSCIGLYVMTEADLYNKTADQVRDSLVWENGETFAHEAALHYASQALGGCSESMVTNHYGNYWSLNFFRPGQYSYAIVDADGQEVFRQGDPIPGAQEYRFPVTGQYLHQVSLETEQDRVRREAQERAAFYGMKPSSSLNGVEIPSDGIAVRYASFISQTGGLLMEAYYDGGETVATFYNAEGAHTTYSEGSQVGYLIFNQDGYLVFRSNLIYPDMLLANTSVLEANLFVPGEVSLQLRNEPNSVGYLYCDEMGTVCFTSLEAVPRVPVAPEVPDVQAPDALTIPAASGIANTSSSIAGEITHIALAAFYGPDGSKLLNLYDPDGIGTLFCTQDGQLAFLIDNDKHQDAYLETLAGTTISGVFFQDPTGEFTYRSASMDGVGILKEDAPHLLWTTQPEAVPAEAEDASEETAPAETSGVEPSEDEHSEERSENDHSEEDSWEEDSGEDRSEYESHEDEQSEEDHSDGESQEDEHEEQTESPQEETPPAAEATAAAEETVPPTEEAPAVTEPVIINGKPLEEYRPETDTYFDKELQQTVYSSYVRLPMPEYTVVLQLTHDALQYKDAYTLLEMLRVNRKFLLPALAVCLLLFAICVVYLSTAAGRKPKSSEIRAGGLNRLPLDLYFAGAFFGIALAANVGTETIQFRFNENVLGSCILAASMAALACILLVAFGFAAVAQVKTPGGFWWRNSLCGQSLRILLRFCHWTKAVLAEKILPASWKFLREITGKCWKLCKRLLNRLGTVLKRFFLRCGKAVSHFFSLLPMTWQWLLIGCIIIFIAALTLNSHNGFIVILGLLVIVAIIVYVSHCFGILSDSAHRMGRGELNTKVDDTLLLGCFKDFAGDLNDLADVAVVAAQKQLRSERMKTELITNVSHDIKTPLTSIINYVDLLQKPHSEQEQEQYLEVLDRQSQRLKKLIDDLMDMSKANTGNMAVEITTVDAVESVNQALGEFSDKLNAALLTPVFRHSEDRLPILADGKLVWRVLSNLLSNAVKYAMPGTRLYIDLMELEGKVILSLKNISREELNLDAEELMERFVRGDDSRNTEGSGLGLNIAKSLMELQRGQLQLLVDGDLFKVTLIFPGK